MPADPKPTKTETQPREAETKSAVKSDVPAKPDPLSTQAGASELDVTEPDVTEPDVKEQFRLALERKRGKLGDAHGGGPAAGGKVGNTQGRAGNKREFRRKSGG